MNLKFCGLNLRRIDSGDLEMLRGWRNDQKIVRFMFYQEYITREMQEKWYKSLSNSDYYFVIEVANSPIGLIHLSANKKQSKTAYAGLFIYDETFWGTQVPVLASMALLRFAFEDLALEKVFAKVRKDNQVARTYNEQLGFKSSSEEIQEINLISYQSRLANLIAQLEKKHTT